MQTESQQALPPLPCPNPHFHCTGMLATPRLELLPCTYNNSDSPDKQSRSNCKPLLTWNIDDNWAHRLVSNAAIILKFSWLWYDLHASELSLKIHRKGTWKRHSLPLSKHSQEPNVWLWTMWWTRHITELHTQHHEHSSGCQNIQMGPPLPACNPHNQMHLNLD